MQGLLIKPETSEDQDVIYAINHAAFKQIDEAELVNQVRRDGHIALSLLAFLNDEAVAHILYSPVTTESNPQNHTVWGLGPVAVLPAFQKQGVGKALIWQSLEQCKTQGTSAIVVLGHPTYYPQFGFEPANKYGLSFRGEYDGEAFMVQELVQGTLASLSGAVHYVPAFER